VTEHQHATEPFPDPREIDTLASFHTALKKMRKDGGWSWGGIRTACRAADEAAGHDVGFYPDRSTFQRWFDKGLPRLDSEALFTTMLQVFGVPDRDLEAWLHAVRRLRLQPRVPIEVEPYRGLESFRIEDAQWFFGREPVVAEALEQIEQLHQAGGGALMLVGVSGAGKSSVLRAGVVAALAQDQISGSSSWPVLFVPPGPGARDALVEQLADRVDDDLDTVEKILTAGSTDTTELLRRVLAPATGAADPQRPGVLVVLDQFEQTLVTETPEQEEALGGLFDLLSTVISSRLGCVVVFGVRANLYGPALGNLRLRALTGGRYVTVAPMNESELRTVIEEPAKMAGAQIEDGFVDLLLRDVSSRRGQAGHDAGALPLLSHALHATWAKGSGKKLTIDNYVNSGGIDGAVAETAQSVYANLTTDQQETAHRLFLRLVHGHASGDEVRVRLPLADLPEEREEPGLREVLNRFIAARLLTADSDTIEISHDALMVAWPTLRQWLRDSRDRRLALQKLEEAAHAWDTGGRRDDYLPQGTRLESDRSWAQRYPAELSSTATDYVEAGLALSRRRTRRLQQTVAGLAGLLVIALVLGVVVYIQQRTTAREREEAVSRAIANQVINLRGKDRSLAAQLALAAYQISPTLEARSALLDATALRPAVRMRGSETTSTMYAVAINPAGTLAAAGVDTTVKFWSFTDAAHPRMLPPLPGGACTRVYALAFQPHGTLLAASCGDGAIHLWDTRDPEHPIALPSLTGLGAKVISATFSPDGAMLAAAIANRPVNGVTSGSVQLWRLTGTRPDPLGPPLTVDAKAAAKSVAFHPGNDYLAVGTDSSKVELLDIRTPEHPRDPIALKGPTKGIGQLTFSPDGKHLAACGQDAATFLWNTTDPRTPTPDPVHLDNSDTYNNAVAFSPDSASLAVASSDSTVGVRIFDVTTGTITATLPHPAPATAVKFSPDGRQVITGANDAVVRIWPVAAPELAGMTYSVSSTRFSPDAHTLAVGSADLRLLDVADPAHPVPLAPPITNKDNFSGTLAFDTDQRTLAEGRGRSGTVQLYDLTDRRHPHPVGSPFQAHTQQVETLDLSPSGDLLATGSRDGAVYLWDIRHRDTPIKISTPGLFDGTVNWVAFNPRGDLLVAAGVDRTVRLWNISDPAHPAQIGQNLKPGPHYAYSAVFSPDGTTLAVSLGDSTVLLYDVTNPAAPRQIGAPLAGPTDYIYDTAFTSTGTTLAAASTDGTVWLWDLTHRDAPVHVATLTLATKSMFTVAFQPGTTTLAGGGIDRKAWLWNTDPAAAATEICATTGDPITETEWNRYVPGHAYHNPCR
jgi:WD40 repeat protein